VHPEVLTASLDSIGYNQLPTTLLDLLNTGVTPLALDAALYTARFANQPVAVASADMTGDGKNEVVVSVYNPDSLSIPPGGALFIYLCQSGQFTLAHQQSSLDNYGAPGILLLEDLNNDQIAELATQSDTCGAHTCFSWVEILVWNGTEIENRLVGTTADLPSPDFEWLEADDGTFALEAIGYGIGSVGAGPQRTRTRIWNYEPLTGFWQPGENILGPSDYRIHVLHDADHAFWNQDYPNALVLYGRVVSDTTLLDNYSIQPYDPATLAAYARFKMVVTYTVMAQPDNAERVLNEMRLAYPPNSPPYPYLEMAELYTTRYASYGVQDACTAVMAYTQTHAEQILHPLGSAVFGYANRDYTPEDMCP
jgi:hypothetical protein